MAKQSVTLVERHAEKVVVGVAASILLAIIVLYIVGNPNSMNSTSGEPINPSQIGQATKTIADNILDTLTNATPTAQPVTALSPRVEKNSPFQMETDLQKRYALAPVLPNLKPPEISAQGPGGGDVKLANILAPGKPTVIQGRNRATLTPPGPLLSESTTPTANPDASNTGKVEAKDLTWVTVIAPVFRARQRAIFSEKNYSPPRYGLFITQIKLQRQWLQPDGTWSQTEDVTTYSKYSPPQIQASFNLTERETGWALDDESESLNTQLWDALKGPEVQSVLWRPPLAPYLDMKEKDWSLPIIPDIDWKLWPQPTPGSLFGGGEVDAAAASDSVGGPATADPSESPTGPAQEPGAGRRPTGAAGGPSTPRPPAGGQRQRPQKREGTIDRAAAIAKAKNDLDEAKKELANAQLENAVKLVHEVISKKNILPAPYITEAEALRVTIESQMTEAQKKIADAELQKKMQEELGMAAETDIEPLWANDITSVPGRTYRYRMQFDVYNRYVGQTTELASRDEAKVVFLQSEWSEWSDPVAVKPEVCFFFSKANSSDKSAMVELYKWAGGLWHRFTPKVEIGDRILINDKRLGIVDSQATVVDVEFGVKRPVKVKTGRGFRIEEKPMDVLLVVDDNGILQERILEEDKTHPEHKEIRDAIQRAREAASGKSPR